MVQNSHENELELVYFGNHKKGKQLLLSNAINLNNF